MVGIIQEDLWRNIAQKYYGENKQDWTFKCPSCGHLRSIKSVLNNNPDLKGAGTGAGKSN